MSSEPQTHAAGAAPARAKNKEPYQQAYYPPVPTRFTRHMRTNPVWQLWRFVVINLKIFQLMFRSHH